MYYHIIGMYPISYLYRLLNNEFAAFFDIQRQQSILVMRTISSYISLFYTENAFIPH